MKRHRAIVGHYIGREYRYQLVKLPHYDNGKQANATVYSDRLFQWDSKKHDELCQKHFGNSGQYWDNRNSDSIQAFLRDYTGDPALELCRVEKGENASTGYPYWRFDYIKSK